MPMPSLFDIRQNMALYGVLRLGENPRGVKSQGWVGLGGAWLILPNLSGYNDPDFHRTFCGHTQIGPPQRSSESMTCSIPSDSLSSVSFFRRASLKAYLMPETRSFTDECVVCFSTPPTVIQGWKCMVRKAAEFPPGLAQFPTMGVAAAAWGKLLRYWGRSASHPLSPGPWQNLQGSCTAYCPVLVHGLPQPCLLPPRLP